MLQTVPQSPTAILFGAPLLVSWKATYRCTYSPHIIVVAYVFRRIAAPNQPADCTWRWFRSLRKKFPTLNAGERVLSNQQIVVIAAYLAGGDSTRVDTEDIAVKANEIAPGRFSWRKYPQQINIDAVRKRLWDACKTAKGGYVLGSEKDGWALTEAGVRFARKSVDAVTGSKKRLSLKERTWLRLERQRLLSTDAFLKYSKQNKTSVTRRDAEGFFRIDNYVKGEAREQKMLRILNAFGDDTELGPAVRRFAAIVRGG